jgi:hypothetical protein
VLRNVALSADALHPWHAWRRHPPEVWAEGRNGRGWVDAPKGKSWKRFPRCPSYLPSSHQLLLLILPLSHPPALRQSHDKLGNFTLRLRISALQTQSLSHLLHATRAAQ